MCLNKMRCKMILTNFLRTAKNIEESNVTKASMFISNLLVLTETVLRLLKGFLVFSDVVFICTTTISLSSVTAIETRRLWFIIPNLAQSLKNHRTHQTQLKHTTRKTTFINIINKKAK